MLKGRGILGRGNSLGKKDAVSLDLFSSWGVANVATVPLLIISWS